MKNTFLGLLLLFAGCQADSETIRPVVQDITESVYASGMVKSDRQYQAFATVSGIVDTVYVDEGAEVGIGTPILSIVNDAQKLMAENARISSRFNALSYNKGKVEEAKSFVRLMQKQLEYDADMLKRQQNLWAQNVGTKVSLDQRELALAHSKNKLASAKEKLAELEKQLRFQAKQAENNLSISRKNSDDFVVKSKVKGKVYQMNLAKGEIVTPQVPIAILGDDKKYLLELQVDEYDIVAIRLGMPVLVVLNSYRDSVFDAVVSKINPIMNVQSKTFTIDAEFVRQPEILYPNISLEANVLISTKKDALLIPRNYLLDDSTVVTKSGEKRIVQTGLKDYQMVEILSGISKEEELVLPER